MNEWMNVIFVMYEIKLSIIAHISYIGDKQCRGTQFISYREQMKYGIQCYR